MEKNVNCLDTVGILEIVGVLMVNTAADGSTFCCEAVKLQAVSYGVSKQSAGNKTEVNCSVCSAVRIVIMFKYVLCQENFRNVFSFVCLVSFKFRNSK